MDTEVQKSKRIAKNTILLYIRMFFMMLIGLYTSRVILNTLGVDDYGIKNVVGGVVSMFSIFSSTISSAISRFITFELGTGNKKRLKVVFSTSIFVQCTMAIIVVVLCEVIGFWFLTNKMVIPDGRMDAAIWVFHSSIIGFGLGLVYSPFSALIIAHEKMDAFAYISILEAIFKLLIVYALLLTSFDKLKLYSVLLLGVSVLVYSIYIIYCRRHFEESHIIMIFDKSLFKHIGSFAGWNLFGHGAWMLQNQGTNLLINLFFGVQVNAARGIANQVNRVIQQFVGNFMTALNPQITKSYAAGDFRYMNSVVLKGAKFSYMLMYIFALPVALETDMILRLWLKKYPEYSVPFVRFTMAISLCMLLVNPFLTALRATGNIKNYQIIIGVVGCLQFPLIYFAFKLGCSPISSYVICLVFYLFFVFYKPWLVRKKIQLSLKAFLNEVILPITWVTGLSVAIPMGIRLIMPESIIRLFLVVLSSFLMTSIVIWLFGLTNSEKIMLKNYVENKFKRIRS